MGEVKIGKITLGMCSTNTYVLYREGATDAIIIDPAENGEMLYDKFKEKGLLIKAILLTHGHFDHIWGVEGIQKRTDAKVYASEDEKDFLLSAHDNMSEYCGKPASVNADVLLKDDEEFELCGIKIRMLKTPGHTVGGCCFYIEEAGFLISGDTLFAQSVGRTDFPKGSMSTLVRSIKEKLLVLPGDTKVYPGHGPSTTIEYEKENNPFL